MIATISNATLLIRLDYYHMKEDVLGVEVLCHGVPRPKVKWFHGKIEVKPSKRYTLLEEAHGVYKLEICQPTAKDSGNYICKAENSVTKAEIIHCVQFLRRPLHFHLHGQQEDAAKRAAEDAVRARELPAIVRTYDKPSVPQKDRLIFVNKLHDRMVLVGSKIKFSCMIMGPDPNIRWLKDGNPVTYGPDVKNLSVEGISVLAISKLTLEHSGEYKCWARNTDSDISTSCQLTVYEAEIKDEQEGPLFILSIRG